AGLSVHSLPPAAAPPRLQPASASEPRLRALADAPQLPEECPMRATVLTRYGDVDGLEIRTVEDPRPKAGEVKLRVTAASLNAIDLKLASGVLKEFFPLKLPAILGFDASGEVAELGEGATGLSTGDRV